MTEGQKINILKQNSQWPNGQMATNMVSRHELKVVQKDFELCLGILTN